MNKIKHFLLMLLAVSCTFGCTDPEPEPTPAELEVSKTALSFTAEGEEQTLDVTSNTSWKVAVSDDAAWLTLSVTSGEGNETLTFTAEANDLEEVRTATLTFSADEVADVEVKVSQAGKDAPIPALSSTLEAAYEFDYQATKVEFEITSNIAWTITSDSEWVTLSAEEGENNGAASFSVAENEGTESRSAVVTIAGEGVEAIEVAISQAAEVIDPNSAIQFADVKLYDALISIGTVDTDKNGEISYTEAAAAQYLFLASMGITSFDEVEYFTSALMLVLNDNNIKELDLTANTALTSVNVNNNGMTSLTFAPENVITALEISNNELTEIDLTGFAELQRFVCSDNVFSASELDLSGCEKLTDIYANNCELTDLEFSTSVNTLEATGNKLDFINITDNLTLSTLNVGDQTTGTCQVVINALQEYFLLGFMAENVNNDVDFIVSQGPLDVVAGEATAESLVLSTDMGDYSGNYAIGIMLLEYDIYGVFQKSPVDLANSLYTTMEGNGVDFTTVDNKYVFNGNLTDFATPAEWGLSAGTKYVVCAFPLNSDGTVNDIVLPTIIYDATAAEAEPFTVSLEVVSSSASEVKIRFTPSDDTTPYFANAFTDQFITDMAYNTDEQIISYIENWSAVSYFIYTGVQELSYYFMQSSTAYAFGIDEGNKATTELFKLPFEFEGDLPSTEGFTVTMELVSSNANTVDVKFIPSDNTTNFFSYAYSESYFAGLTDEEIIAKIQTFGYGYTMYIWHGEETKNIYSDGDKMIAYAFGVDASNVPATELFKFECNN